MISPLNKKLEQVKWGEFKITDLAVPLKGKRKLTKDNLSSNGRVDVYSSDSSNNGIVGQTDLDADYLVSEKNPFYIVFGDHTRSMNIASRNFSVMDNVKVLSPKFKTIKDALFICSAWKKAIPNLGYSRHWSVAKNIIFQLPVNQNGEPDFEFINDFVAELEAERVAELEAYLTVTGLKDYELTEKETLVLKNFNNINFSIHKLDDLFTIQGTKSLDSNAVDFVKEGVNFVGRTFDNNGIQGKILKRDFVPNEANTITATVIGNYKYVKYQTEEYYCSQNINKLTPKIIFRKWNKEIAYFLVTHIQKFVSLYDGQQGGYKLNDIKNHVIFLPTNDSQIDFDTMETLISAVKKLVIKDVVEYVNNKIEATKKAINQ